MTRGIKNNNPLNIRHSADQWQGAREEQTDKEFVQFTSMAYGYRAAWKNKANETSPWALRRLEH